MHRPVCLDGVVVLGGGLVDIVDGDRCPAVSKPVMGIEEIAVLISCGISSSIGILQLFGAAGNLILFDPGGKRFANDELA